MLDIEQIRVNHIKELHPSDIQLDFYYEDTYGYLYIHGTISPDTG